MIRVFAIVGSILVAIIAIQTHRLKGETKGRIAAEARESQLRATIQTERDDRRLADATIDRLVKDLDAVRAQPPITGVRCRTVRLPGEGRSAATPDATSSGAVEGLSAGDPVGDQSSGPEIDVSNGLDWYASRCSELAVTHSALQGWERQRAH